MGCYPYCNYNVDSSFGRARPCVQRRLTIDNPPTCLDRILQQRSEQAQELLPENLVATGEDNPAVEKPGRDTARCRRLCIASRQTPHAELLACESSALPRSRRCLQRIFSDRRVVRTNLQPIRQGNGSLRFPTRSLDEHWMADRCRQMKRPQSPGISETAEREKGITLSICPTCRSLQIRHLVAFALYVALEPVNSLLARPSGGGSVYG